MGTATGSGLAEQSTAAAMAAATAAGVEVLPIDDATTCHRVARLLSEIWAVDDQPIVAAEIIRTLAHVNAYGAFARSGEEVVGAALGFLGNDELGAYLHSYVTGVRQRRRGSSVGFALKQHQRAWALRRGLSGSRGRSTRWSVATPTSISSSSAPRRSPSTATSTGRWATGSMPAT